MFRKLASQSYGHFFISAIVFNAVCRNTWWCLYDTMSTHSNVCCLVIHFSYYCPLTPSHFHLKWNSYYTLISAMITLYTYHWPHTHTHTCIQKNLTSISSSASLNLQPYLSHSFATWAESIVHFPGSLQHLKFIIDAFSLPSLFLNLPPSSPAVPLSSCFFNINNFHIYIFFYYILPMFCVPEVGTRY